MKIALVIVIALFGLGGLAQNGQAPTSGPEYTSDGQMKLPENYREWVYLTTGFDMSYNPAMNMGHHMFDNVFVNPEAYKAFLNTGTWPDKTVMVLEGRGAQSRGSINKAGNFQGEVMGIEVHVKDEARFPGKVGFLRFRRRQNCEDDSANRQLLFVSRGTCSGGHDICAVLSDAAADCDCEGDIERRLSKRFSAKMSRTTAPDLRPRLKPRPTGS